MATSQSINSTICTLHSLKQEKARPFLDRPIYSTFTKTGKKGWNVAISLVTTNTMERHRLIRNKCISTIRVGQRKYEIQLAQYTIKQPKPLFEYVN